MSVEKVALITAGGSGMGAAAARKLAQDGYRIAVLSSSGKGETLAQDLGGVGVTGSNQSNDDLQLRLQGLAELHAPGSVRAERSWQTLPPWTRQTYLAAHRAVSWLFDAACEAASPQSHMKQTTRRISAW